LERYIATGSATESQALNTRAAFGSELRRPCGSIWVVPASS
jgi:hypothetical protein